MAPTPDKILELGTAFWASKTLLSAAELGLFTELAKHGPLDAEALRARIGIHARGARDFFDALVALGMLRREGDGPGARYADTPETDLFLDEAKPSYVGGLLEMCNQRQWPIWGKLTDALRTGRRQSEVEGDATGLFDSLYADPERLRTFLRAMTGVSLGPARAIAAKFPFERAKTFADIGTAAGTLPIEVASAHPHLAGIGWDLPIVRPIFEDHVRARGLAGRLRFEAGDFFKDPLPSADVLTMGHILHDWDLDQKRMLLEKALAALPAGGSLIVYEGIIDDERRKNAFGLLMSVNMLVETDGGFDFTGADCQGWMREAGFRETRVEPLVGPYSMVVGVK